MSRRYIAMTNRMVLGLPLIWKVSLSLAAGLLIGCSAKAAQSAKPTSPVRLRLEVSSELTELRGTVTMLDTAEEVKLTLYAEGDAVIDDRVIEQFQNVEAQRELHHLMTPVFTDAGHATFALRVDVRGVEGVEQFSQEKRLYALRVEEELFISDVSPMQVELDYLAERRKRGQLTADQYEEARDQILGGGAEAEIIIEIPEE